MEEITNAVRLVYKLESDVWPAKVVASREKCLREAPNYCRTYDNGLSAAIMGQIDSGGCGLYFFKIELLIFL